MAQAIITKVPLIKHIHVSLRCIALVVILVMLKTVALAQCTVYERVYATSETYSQGLLTSIDDDANAADGDPTTFSQLNRTIGVPLIPLGDIIQYLKFGNTVSSGTPVSIKLSLPPGLLSLLGGVTIQPFIGAGHTAVGPAISDNTLLGLLGGTGDSEITLTPPGNYDGISVRMSGVAILQKMKIYDAYYMKASTNTTGCSIPMDVETGNKPMTILGSIGSVLGQTSHPERAIDTNSESFAEIDAVATVLSEVYHTTIFNSPSQPGDTVRMIVQNSGSGLLNVDVGSGFSIQFYNGNIPVDTLIAGESNSLKLHLFPDGSERYELDVSPSASLGVYDRVQVSVGGVVSLGLTQGLKIYNVWRTLPKPVVNGTTSSTQTVCAGNTTTFTVTNAQACTTYTWYDAQVGGNVLQSDPNNPNYTPPTTLAAGNYQFYVQATRNGCTETTTRSPAVLKVNPLPGIVTTGHPRVCTGDSTTTVSYTTSNAANTYSIVWNTAAHNQLFSDVTDKPLPTGDITVDVPKHAIPATYNGILTVKNTNGCISSQQPFSVDVDALPVSPAISLTP